MGWPNIRSLTPETRSRGNTRTLYQGLRVRKNYLFAGSDSGGGRAAAIYSLIGSAVQPNSMGSILRRVSFCARTRRGSSDQAYRRAAALEGRATCARIRLRHGAQDRVQMGWAHALVRDEVESFMPRDLDSPSRW